MPLGCPPGEKFRSDSNAMTPFDFCVIGEFVTVTVDVAELSEVFGSGTGELADAVLLITVPALALTVTVKRIASDASGASPGICTLTLFPLPPQTPVPAVAHWTSDVPTGRLSVTVIVAGTTPLFFTISE